MDIKERIEEIVKKLSDNADLKEKFQQNPIQTVEELLGVDLPDELLEKVIDGVKTKITVEQLSGAMDFLKKLF